MFAKLKPVLAAIPAIAVLASAPALAADACDITDLPCWGDDSKCNIKIANNTGKSSGSGGSHLKQISWAVTIKVKAITPDGTRAGSNTREILAGQSKTINLDKKAGFDRIEILTSTGPNANVKIPCDEIRQILEADKHCKVLVDQDDLGDNTYYYLAYNCDVAWGKGDDVWIW